MLRRWERLPARIQVLVAWPACCVFLAAIHLVFFPWLTAARALSYAVFEAVPLALLVVFATQTELARRANAAAPPLDDDAGSEPPAR
jgi:hypothetical protein